MDSKSRGSTGTMTTRSRQLPPEVYCMESLMGGSKTQRTTTQTVTPSSNYHFHSFLEKAVFNHFSTDYWIREMNLGYFQSKKMFSNGEMKSVKQFKRLQVVAAIVSLALTAGYNKTICAIIHAILLLLSLVLWHVKFKYSFPNIMLGVLQLFSIGFFVSHEEDFQSAYCLFFGFWALLFGYTLEVHPITLATIGGINLGVYGCMIIDIGWIFNGDWTFSRNTGDLISLGLTYILILATILFINIELYHRRVRSAQRKTSSEGLENLIKHASDAVFKINPKNARIVDVNFAVDELLWVDNSILGCKFKVLINRKSKMHRTVPEEFAKSRFSRDVQLKQFQTSMRFALEEDDETVEETDASDDSDRVRHTTREIRCQLAHIRRCSGQDDNHFKKFDAKTNTSYSPCEEAISSLMICRYATKSQEDAYLDVKFKSTMDEWKQFRSIEHYFEGELRTQLDYDTTYTSVLRSMIQSAKNDAMVLVDHFLSKCPLDASENDYEIPIDHIEKELLVLYQKISQTARFAQHTLYHMIGTGDLMESVKCIWDLRDDTFDSFLYPEKFSLQEEIRNSFVLKHISFPNFSMKINFPSSSCPVFWDRYRFTHLCIILVRTLLSQTNDPLMANFDEDSKPPPKRLVLLNAHYSQRDEGDFFVISVTDHESIPLSKKISAHLDHLTPFVDMEGAVQFHFVRCLVNHMDGFIKVDSPTDRKTGKGNCITVGFPLPIQIIQSDERVVSSSTLQRSGHKDAYNIVADAISRYPTGTLHRSSVRNSSNNRRSNNSRSSNSFQNVSENNNRDYSSCRLFPPGSSSFLHSESRSTRMRKSHAPLSPKVLYSSVVRSQ
eukprot:TRINITY_DN178844_c0_g1_i1.p1 TRINITY_DN178844_c0_g1~~TRINITY_DN178844_c0_g1_i1.p1  ORF type:complete len:837 (+),score=137.45 TRINITY_DN178844_c0_g1_i1:134-2644(+)